MLTKYKHGPYPPWPPCSGSLCTVVRKRAGFHPLSPYLSAIQEKGEGDEGGGQNQGDILLFGTCYFFKCKKRERNSIKKSGEKYYAALSPI